MKVRHLVSTAITVLTLASWGSSVLAAKRNTSQIHFRPTLLSDFTTVDPTAAAIPATVSLTSTTPIIATSEALTASPAPAATDTSEAAVADSRYSHTISALELQGDLYAFALREPLLARANQHLQSGNTVDALEDLERAMQITRIQQGLSSIGQASIMRTMIDTYVQMDDIPNAHRLQEALLHLQARYYGSDSTELVPALLEWADWNVNLYLGGQLAETTQVPTTQGSLPLGDPNPYMQEAHMRYVNALEILHTHADPKDANLVTIERKLAAVNFMVDRDMLEVLQGSQKAAGDEFDLNSDRTVKRVRNFHFINGDTALKRALAYGYLSPEPDQDYIAARMLELADWNLLFDHRVTALDLYRQTLELLATSNLSQQEIDNFFAGGLPVQTPDTAYEQALEPQAFTGYIDVEVKLNKYGAASDTRLLTDANADPDVVDELLRRIRSAKFRPVFAQGNPKHEEAVKLRYFYALR
jgi:hypothetical protein